MTGEPASRDAVLRRIRESREPLDAFVDALDEQDLSRAVSPGWTARDVLAHITAWETSLLALLQGADRGQAMGLDPGAYGRLDEDELNEALRRVHAASSSSEVLERYRHVHSRLIDRLSSMDDAALQLPYSHYQPNDPPHNATPVVQWVAGNTWDHYDEHLATLRAALPGRGETR